MLPSNNTGINFQFYRLQNYGKKHAEKVDLKRKFKAKKRLVSVFHCFNKISG
jgi:hypothetical protein